MNFARSLAFIGRHPLNKGRELDAFIRFAAWQISSRLGRKDRKFRFVENLYLNARRGETGVTGNLYCGLHEFAEMGFLLHFLRPGNLFIDVGANAGSYSVLAAATGAEVIAFEPGEAFERLIANIKLNRLSIDARFSAVGAYVGEIRFSQGLDTVNRIAHDGEASVAVPVTTLDALSKSPDLIKIDVEGFEPDVLKGAVDTLSTTRAVIIESATACHYTLVKLGFSAFAYDPITRTLSALDTPRAGFLNTLYLRDAAAAQALVSSARTYRVGRGQV